LVDVGDRGGNTVSAPAFGADAIGDLSPAELFSLEGSVAIVTGAAGGIGRWLAGGLGAAGASVLLTDVEGSGLEELEAALAAAGIDAAGVTADLTDEEAPDVIVGAAMERFGAVHVVVNNAAVNKRMPIQDMDGATWDWIVRINLRAPYFLAQRAAREMIAQGAGGSIISTSSLNVAYALEHVSVYGATKAAISQTTRHMALEWAEHGIRVNAIAPGFMDTPLAEPIWADPETSRWIHNRVPMERPGHPSELVGTCLLLASEAGSFLTGQTLIVDGGAQAGGRWFHPDR
jgi:NAD(P)-dependent dehydrogenase (short-subunit alcohol dehydrogenase family)